MIVVKVQLYFAGEELDWAIAASYAPHVVELDDRFVDFQQNFGFFQCFPARETHKRCEEVIFKTR